ncbi:intracellular protein transport protein USO1-like isoform X2 [Copidosoma floridanum]|uniref:intracellular protein transport protein USO1-like isoform X2 n=1 Tax=Copidosoma floridanum TaxID=29053 RepID=UPI0006C9BD42|nr:intracellular protein transport protein USO1-like isoform X2 [Copidosoma floridanum]
MLSLWLCCCWASSLLVAVTQAYPVTPAHGDSTGPDELFKHWDDNWLKYTIGILSITVSAFTLVGCLCCHRNRRPKGFQEFKDGGSIDNDSSVPQLQGLELQVPTPNCPTQQLISDRVQFEPLPPVERFAPEIGASPWPKLPPPSSPSLFDENSESDRSTLHDSCHEWFQKTDLHVPREKLKYLREIGHGWFGKVVEGCADIQGTNLGKPSVKGGNVVVRILTEEASAREKAWFLGEATPYFKLRHRNILSLFGSCLETDPYLLLFESCPLGDLKGFLHSNQDPQTRAALVKENLPTRIAIEIGAGLRHMHEHKLAHTDLAARNCLVASDLSIKLGDYGIGVEKYPEDYYVLGDRALPIRWSAPETIECTETTIETREITPQANIWNYAVLMWEIAMWGKRPYSELSDEKVIEVLLSPKSELKASGSQLLLQNCDNCASNLLEAIKTCLVLKPENRLPLEKVRHVLLKDQLEAESSDFEQRWLNLRPNVSTNQTRSASLQDLRGSLDSEQWPSLMQTSFRLGPEEPVKNVPGGTVLARGRWPFRESDSETEEESWRGRVERGAYTEKVKQKSKSVADLMVLVHIEPDSDADLSLGPQTPMTTEKTKKRLVAIGSDGDLPSSVFDEQFDLALRNLRDIPLVVPANAVHVSRAAMLERPKKLALTEEHRTQIVKLVEPDDEKEAVEKNDSRALNEESESILHQLSETKINQVNCTLPLTEKTTKSQLVTSVLSPDEAPCFSNNFQVTDLDDEETDTTTVVENLNYTKSGLMDVSSWNSALESALKRKATEFGSYDATTPSPMRKIEAASNEEAITPSPQSRAEYSTEDVEDEFSNAEDLPGLSKRNLPLDDEDDRKRMSTPDDERSSDSGFRDKESCEEEESPLAGPLPNLVASQSNTPKSSATHDSSAEDEQMRILIELDTILDAECYGASLNDSSDPSVEKSIVQDSENLVSTTLEHEVSEMMAQSSSEATGETIQPIDKSSTSDEVNPSTSALLDSQPTFSESDAQTAVSNRAVLASSDGTATSVSQAMGEISSWPCLASLNDNNEDEDSSTMSMRSDNSYLSFGMDEEFVAAIRNELREKLPHAQMPVVEVQEPYDEDEPSIVSDIDSKNWEDEVEDAEFRSGAIDISIRYNTFGTPLSPIMEERDSATDSTNVTRDNSRDASTASKGGSNSVSEDDVLLIDTQTNHATLVEGSSHSHESREFSNQDMPDDAQLKQCSKPSYPLDKRFSGTMSGGTGAPLPSPEDEDSKWQSGFPMLPYQIQDNLMSTSFSSEQDWDSNEEDGHEVPSVSISNELDEDDDDDDDNGMLDEDDDDDDEESSSSSGEFVWQQYNTGHIESHEGNSPKIEANENTENDLGEDFDSDEDEKDDDDDDDDEEEEEEFTPSAWDATLAPHRSALRSPDKSLRTGDQKKSVWFKKQRYHCVYEYPKETPTQAPNVPAWEPTSYTDWEEMIDNIDRMNFQPMDYFETNNTRGEEEFFVSSSNRPFQFQSGNGKNVSQFFPGAGNNNSESTPKSQEDPSQKSESQSNNEEPTTVSGAAPQFFSDRQQLGKLRHTRDRLKLNLVTSLSNGNGKNVYLCTPVKQGKHVVEDDDDDDDDDEEEEDKDLNKQTRLADKNFNEAIVVVDESNNISTGSEIRKNETVPMVQLSSQTSPKTSPSDAGQCSSSGSLDSKSKCDNVD